MNTQNELIKRIINQHQFKIISFDIFDTLLYRPAIFPTDVLSLIREKAQISFGKFDFYSARLNAETKMRAKSKLANDSYSIFEIYDFIAKEHGLDHEKCQAICKDEMQIEKTVLQVRPDIKELYEYAVSLGKRIIAVSDMYLPSSFLRDVLEDREIFVSSLYVSCEHGRRKDRGDFFQYITNREGVSSFEVLHIGDNLNSDYHKTIESGVPAFHIPSSIENVIKSNNKYKYLFKRFNSLEVNSRILIGLAFSSWFSRSGVQVSPSLYFNNDLKMFGFIGLGPALFHIASSIANNKEIQKNYSVINFTSRDGYLPKKAYDIISKYQKLRPSFYLYAGRMAYDIYRFKGDLFSYFTGSVSREKGYTLRSLIYSLFADKNQDLLQLMLAEFKCDELDSDYQECSELIRNACEKYQSQLISFFTDERHIAAEYYKENLRTVNNRAIVFDVGYSGSISNAIGELTGFFIDKIYLQQEIKNVNIDARNKTKTWRFFQDSANIRKSVPGFYLLFEELFSSSEAACVGFRKSPEGKIQPLFASGENFSAAMLADLQQVQDGAIEFVELAMQALGPYFSSISVKNPSDLALHLVRAFSKSHSNEGRIFRNIFFSDFYFLNSSSALSEKLHLGKIKGNVHTRDGLDDLSRMVSSRSDRPSELLKDVSRVGIHLHFFSFPAFFELVEILCGLPLQFTLIVTLCDPKYEPIVRSFFNKNVIINLKSLVVKVVPSRGIDVAPWLIFGGDIQKDLDFIFYINPKDFRKFGHSSNLRGSLARNFVSPEAVSDIFTLFSQDKRIGLILPASYKHAFPIMGASGDVLISDEALKLLQELMKKMNILSNIGRGDSFFSVGEMFWYRTSALIPLFNVGLDLNGFQDEPHIMDSSVSQAVARLPHVVSDFQGYETKIYISQREILEGYLSGQVSKGLLQNCVGLVSVLSLKLSEFVCISKEWALCFFPPSSVGYQLFYSVSRPILRFLRSVRSMVSWPRS
ncbi:MAG: rhamnan synthesis F family protein [Bdellovibrionia bacterium]